jgi:hypothetical protein
LKLALFEHPDGVETEDGTRVVYDVAREEAHFGAARVEGHALVWELGEREEGAKLSAEVEPESGAWLLRCDRVDFPPRGVAYRHTHPGPGIRCLLSGSIRIETQGSSHDYGPFEAWFERGSDPVYAAASETEDSAFVRVMLLPAEWRGKRTIHYVDPADEAKPKLQRARVFFDESIFL